MPKLKLTIQYDGTLYSGWQRQKRHETVQSIIEEALSEIFKKEIKIRGAGRTDAGVHALGQIATFTVNNFLPMNVLKKALNAILPSDIRITDIEEVENTFHPQYSVKKKAYVYYICNDEFCPVFLQRFVWHFRGNLDFSLIQKAAEIFQGTHDFTAFSGSTEVKDRIRTIHSLTVELFNSLCFLDMKIDGNFIKFRIEADGFLKYMVRNIVGCLVELGRGALSENTIIEALKTGRRPNPLRTAPPQGLFLEKVFY
ncbi:tRNA pseudouridine(38-40) synthase TruA [Thermodesulfovibrio sp.]|uniref:tRNA pseudouridine(38-40) synthase TruA n=1 Tax=Thermodesulfovibrio sp. TaxID=2067987 RepID=UPI0030B74667